MTWSVLLLRSVARQLETMAAAAATTSATASNSSESSCPPLLAPETVACARGVCVDAVTCTACEEGWIPQADFAFGAPACATNVSAVTAFWAVAAAFSALFGCGALAALAYVYWMRRDAESRGRQEPHSPPPHATGQRLPTTLREWARFATASPHRIEFTVISLMTLTSAACMVALGLLRATNPARVLGTDIAASWLCTGHGVSSWIVIFTFTTRFTRVAAGVRHVASSSFSALAHAQMRAHPLLVVAPVLIPLTAHSMPAAMLLATSSEQMAAMAMIFYLLNACGAIVAWFMTIVVILVPLARVLHERDVTFQAADARFEKLVRKFHRFKCVVELMLVLLVGTFVTWGVWPFLQQRASTYLYPTMAVGIQGMLLLEFLLLVPVRRGPSSASGRSSKTSKVSHKEASSVVSPSAPPSVLRSAPASPGSPGVGGQLSLTAATSSEHAGATSTHEP